MEKTKIDNGSAGYVYAIGIIMGHYFIHDAYGIAIAIRLYFVFAWATRKISGKVRLMNSIAHK